MAAYTDATRAPRAAPTILIETVFDTLNAKAALFAIEAFFEELARCPLMSPGTITDRSGHAVGPDAEAFWNSVRTAKPSRGGPQLRARRTDLRPYSAGTRRAVSDTFICAYPNAGLPNAFGGVRRDARRHGGGDPQRTRAGLLNIVGGCCGTTPGHPRHRGASARRRAAPIAGKCRLAGLEPLNIGDDTLFVNVGERTVTGSAKFRKLITGRATMRRSAPPAGGERRPGHRRQHGRGHARRRRRDGAFLNLVATEPDIARVPLMIDSSSGR